jgi:hypothetical protein
MNQDRSLVVALLVIVALVFFIVNDKASSKSDHKPAQVILNEQAQHLDLEKLEAREVVEAPKKPATKVTDNSKKSKWSEISKSHTLRDFNRFPCKDRRRIGGEKRFIDAVNNPMERIDGAWYVCFDEFVKPTPNACLVFSFGINTDESFDLEMNHKYGCNVYSFDPAIEAARFAAIRISDQKLSQAVEIKVNDKWSFYRIGIQGARSNLKIPQDLKINSFLNFDEILELTGKKNQVIDIFKMDIENGEKTVLEEMDIDYFCKYVKQYELEIHSAWRKKARQLMSRLEKCFYLYFRDTRFYMHERDGPGGYLTEFQLKSSGVAIELASFRDDIELADYIFTMGELYFINLNFVV